MSRDISPTEQRFSRSQMTALRGLADQAFSRAAGAPLIPGNRVRLLKDARENYPAWIEAIESAEKWIHFETYILHQDDIGQHFAELLADKAHCGVKVRLVYDWVGSLLNARPKFWRRLMRMGIDVRCYNPPNFESPFGWLSRDHRKLLTVDGRVGFITGLCIGQRWVGYPEEGIAPWRDTGVEIEGPALLDIERSFADTWNTLGEPLPAGELPSEPGAEVGDTALRIVATIPNVAGIYRLDQLVAALARRAIWISDAYFLGSATYVQALRAASSSGVDVRLLVPAASDMPLMGALSRSGLRPLLEAGVRVYEWNGTMMHAKTSVVDGLWARVGSTNLNFTSWLGNRELDVVVEDEAFAAQMEEMFLEDLANSTEIVLDQRIHRPRERRTRTPRRRNATPSKAAAGVMRLGHSVGAAIASRRELGPAEAVTMFWAAVLLVVLSVIAWFWPRVVTIPLVTLALWFAISLIVRAYYLYRKKVHRE